MEEPGREAEKLRVLLRAVREQGILAAGGETEGIYEGVPVSHVPLVRGEEGRGGAGVRTDRDGGPGTGGLPDFFYFFFEKSLYKSKKVLDFI